MLAVALGVVIGLTVGMLGGGGAILTVPVLVYVLHQDVQSATTTSLIVVAGASAAGAFAHARGGTICWPHILSFTPPALFGTIVGTWGNHNVSATVLLVAFAALMLVAAVATWRKAGVGDTDIGGAQCPPVEQEKVALAGLVVGVLTGFLGVGGGFVIVPVLAILLAMSMRGAIGTSLVIVTVVSVFGLGVHLVSGSTLELAVAGPLAVGCLAGAIVGPALGRRLSPRTLGHGFAVLVAAVGVYVLTSTVLAGGPPGA